MNQDPEPTVNLSSSELAWALVDAEIAMSCLVADDCGLGMKEFAERTHMPIEVVIAACLRGDEPEDNLCNQHVLFTYKKETKELGRLGKLELRLFSIAWKPENFLFLPSEKLMRMPLDRDFKSAFENAIMAINALDSEKPIESKNYVIQWGLTWDDDLPPPTSLIGNSLGGAIAIGALYLLRQVLPKGHRRRRSIKNLERLFSDETPRWTITAGIKKQGQLCLPGGVNEKLEIGTCPDTVYLGSHSDWSLENRHPENRRVIPVYDLSTLLASLEIADLRPRASPQLKDQKTWVQTLGKVAIAVICLVFVWIVGKKVFIDKEVLLVDSPTLKRSRQFEEIVDVGKSVLPSGCSEIFEITKLFTQSEWENSIQPILAGQTGPFALILGDKEKFVSQKSPVSLSGFSALRHLHTLTLFHSNITQIPELGTLPQLERLSLLGSSIESLESASTLKSLRTLVINSGYLKKYPTSYEFPNLENLILHVDDQTKIVELSGCKSLKRLCICGEELTHVLGMKGLPIAELAIYASKLSTFQQSASSKKIGRDFFAIDPLSRLPALVGAGNILPIGLKNLALHRISKIEHLDLTGLSGLQTLRLRAVAIENIIVSEESRVSKSWKSPSEINIRWAPKLNSFNFEGFNETRKCTINHSLLSNIEHLEDATEGCDRQIM